MERDVAKPLRAPDEPNVWLLTGHRAGDNSQVLALAEALGWPFEAKRFVYQPYELVPNMLLGPTLLGRRRAKSSELRPPWPDLVISAGRRNEPIGRWIRKRADKPVKLVHVGRPWARFERFDLVITTPQYRLPERPNVLRNGMPLQRVSESRLAEAAAHWAPRVADLPRPYVAVVVGGTSGPYTFDARAADRLARQADALARRHGGSLLVTTSARTPAEVTETLQARLSSPTHFFRWTPGAQDNPYFGYLALADCLVVTGDSVSMLTEACATRKPVYIFDVGEGRYTMRRGTGQEPDAVQAEPPPDRPRRPFDLRAFIYWQAMRFGPRRLTRDIRIVHEHLTSTGRAVWLGESLPEDAPPPPPLDDVPRAVARIQALFGPAKMLPRGTQLGAQGTMALRQAG